MKKHIQKLAVLLMATVLFSGSQLVYAQATPDKTPPSDVENVKATPGDSEVQLTWDASTDNVNVTGYKIHRGTHTVKTSDDTYDLPVIPVGAVKTYTVKNLTNNKPYYFSMTAVDAAGNESKNYAIEVSATPKSGLRLSSIEDNGKNPQVKEVKAEDVVSVQVIFSEPVRLPAENPTGAFRIQKLTDKSALAVQKAVIDARDVSGSTVILTTAPQAEGVEYLLTVGLEVKDYFDNAIISGTADTGSFKGSAKKKPTEEAPKDQEPDPAEPSDKEAPKVSGGAADLNDRISITFSEPIAVGNNSKSQFIIYKKGTQEQLPIINVSLSVDEKTAYLSTQPQQNTEYDIRIAGVKDKAGNMLANGPVSVILRGNVSGIKDTIPPEEVTKLIARIKDAKTNLVELKWEASKNSAGDLAEQLMYQGNGKAAQSFGASVMLGQSATSREVAGLQGGRWYTFKVATKDTSGNESLGSLASLYLPRTGPGVVAAGVTALVMGLYSRKKK